TRPGRRIWPTSATWRLGNGWTRNAIKQTASLKRPSAYFWLGRRAWWRIRTGPRSTAQTTRASTGWSDAELPRRWNQMTVGMPASTRWPRQL
ncbi:uncharacterized protein METZ01_LOCUS287281, partial [marine metagenome]